MCSALSSTSSNVPPREVLWYQGPRPIAFPRLFLETEHRGERLRHEAAIGQRSKLDQPHAIRKGVQSCPRGHLHRQAGLAAAAGARERQHACGADHPFELGDLLLPADEARQRVGQVVLGW